MIDVIQIYKSKEVFNKSSYTTENRRLFNSWEDSFESVQGYLENETLVLPIEYKNLPDIKTANLIIIQDIEGWDSLQINNYFEGLDLPDWFKKTSRNFFLNNNKKLFAFKQLSIAKSFEIFRIQKSNNGLFKLEIDYSMEIGIPKRENHKLCDLRKSQPIRYKTNGKSDFTMSGRKERTFYEFDYVIEWIGTAKKIEYKELNQIKKSKKISVDSLKLIDERKILK